MALDKRDARAAVEIGSLALGSLATVLPGVSARLFGTDPVETRPLARLLGIRSVALGAVLIYADDDDEVERLLLATAAVASADCLNSILAAAQGRVKWYGPFVHLLTSGTIAGFASWALAES